MKRIKIGGRKRSEPDTEKGSKQIPFQLVEAGHLFTIYPPLVDNLVFVKTSTHLAEVCSTFSEGPRLTQYFSLFHMVWVVAR